MSITRSLAPLLLLLSSSLAAQGSFGPGVLLSQPGDEAVVPSARNQSETVIAASDSSFLAVWTDRRADLRGYFDPEQSARDLYAARLDAAGNVLDTTPLVLSQEYGQQEAAQVAWNGSHWLVTWENQSPTQFFYATEVLAVRVAPDGTVLDDPPISAIKYQSSSSIQYSLTTNGPNWLVVAQGSSVGETDLFGVRLGPDGAKLDPAPVVLVPGGSSLLFNIGVASAGGEYLLFYTATNVVRARRFSGQLGPIGGTFGLPSTYLGASPSGYFVLWSSGASVLGSPFDLAGNLAFPAGLPLASSFGFSPASGVDVDWDGSTWWPSWYAAQRGIVTARVSAAGQVLDPGGVGYPSAPPANTRNHDAAAIPGGGLRMVWEDSVSTVLDPQDVRTGSFDAGGAPRPDAPVSLAAPAQARPDLAAGLDGYLEVYRSEASRSLRILARRLDRHGRALDAEPIELATGVSATSPRVAWNGSLYLVAWSEGGSVLGRRVLPDGTLLDAAPVVLASGFDPDVEALGSTFLVLFRNQTFSIQFVSAFYLRVDGPTGAVLDPTPIAVGQSYAREPKLTVFGNRWLGTWQRNFSHDDPGASIQAVLIEADGTTSGEFTVTFTGGTPDVAASGSVALFVWRTNRDTSSDFSLAGRRMQPDGTLLGPLTGDVLIDAPDKQMHPRLVWNGTSFVLAWDDMRAALTFYDERTGVYAARIDEAGQVLDPGGVAVIDDLAPATRPVLATLQGRTLLVASRFESEAPFGAYRLVTAGLGAWTDLGFGLAGTAGVPALEGSGSLLPGASVELRVSNARASTLGAFVLGTTRSDLPFKGGVLVPTPTSFVFFSTNAAGESNQAVALPPTLPTVLTVYGQAWILDPQAPQGFAASNAISAVAP